jgi:hypothetical protein
MVLLMLRRRWAELLDRADYLLHKMADVWGNRSL